jgi:hypothetical protein
MDSALEAKAIREAVKPSRAILITPHGRSNARLRHPKMRTSAALAVSRGKFEERLFLSVRP